MLDILRRYGVPEHLVNLIHLLHTDVTVRVAVGKVEAEISSTVGVKEGDTLAPVLFLFVEFHSSSSTRQSTLVVPTGQALPPARPLVTGLALSRCGRPAGGGRWR
jgi:hypothetical protein